MRRPPIVPEGDHTSISVVAVGEDPGESTRYTLTFTAGMDIPTGTGSFTVKMEDFGLPSSIDESDITMRITEWAFWSTVAIVNATDTG